MPDQAVRVAIGQYDASGTLVYGPVKIGVSGQSYQIVLDYVSVDAANVSVYIERLLVDPTGNVPPKEVSVFDDAITTRTEYRVFRVPESGAFAFASATNEKPKGERVVIPVYVGVGLRLTAAVTVTKGTANLSSLGAIAADAESGRITGSLIVQT
ncbi:MAG TPA: hypothetical protein VFR24_15570 [Candidatus Angelobacter sp.]|nr:hypothetical protein [Candidatus Angelobacter sp.]